MKIRCNIEFDEDNYITRIVSLRDGEYILPENFDFIHLNCYYISRSGDDYEFILDENKVAELNQKIIDSDEIEDLQKKLNNSDYIIAQAFEEVLALNNPLTFVADVIKIMIKYSTEYHDTLINRKNWRNRIRDLRR